MERRERRSCQGRIETEIKRGGKHWGKKFDARGRCGSCSSRCCRSLLFLDPHSTVCEMRAAERRVCVFPSEEYIPHEMCLPCSTYCSLAAKNTQKKGRRRRRGMCIGRAAIRYPQRRLEDLKSPSFSRARNHDKSSARE